MPSGKKKGGWVDLGAGVAGSEKSTPTGFRTPDRLVRSGEGGGGSKNEGKKTINKSNKVEGKEFWGLSPPAGS